MKITVQEKIAELERRIEALEKPRRSTVTQTTTTSHTAPMTPTQQASLDRMWKHSDGVFDAMRSVFR